MEPFRAGPLTRQTPKASRQPLSPWPHRLAWGLAVATFVLLYVGGTVTTYNAGMAIYDWPTTEGYWWYPLPKWLAADWDVFLEHGHRLLAQLVGLITIALVVAIWRLDPRKWMRWLGAAALMGVLLQGVLGGLRVLGSDILLAKVHGCTGPLFFALCATLVTLTSPRWHQIGRPKPHPAARRLHGLARALAVSLYLEIVLGAQLRHVLPVGVPGWFNLWLWLKLILAGLILIGVAWLAVDVMRRMRTETILLRRASLLGALFAVQLVLGAATWVTNYGWPVWFKTYVWPIAYTVVAEGGLQVVTTTAHAAIGSLNLAVALSLALWSWRRLERAPRGETGREAR
jgi:cytochrome c oxidase assembly protein subunit 15